MTLEEFITEQWNDVLKFRRMWIESNEQDSERYPMEMIPGDWDEQFFYFDPGDYNDFE
ncbi:MAG: hypothetical protein WC919_05420 [Candidatus Paceibacterota bacterium]|jgi:hypothetical protein